MNQVTNTAPSSVGAISALKRNLANVRARIPNTASDPFLRLLKDGEWVFGQEDNVLKPGTEVIINTLSIQHGYTCWSNSDDQNAKNELLGEVMVPLTAMPPAASELPDHGYPWKDQLQFDVKIITGIHKGKQVAYKVSSVGGMNAAKAVLDAIMARLDEDTEHVFPIVQLGTDHYKHKKWGKTYTPVLNIVGWADINGEEAGAAPREAPMEEPVEEPKRVAPPEEAPVSRRRAAEPAEENVRSERAADPEPAKPDSAVPVRRRR